MSWCLWSCCCGSWNTLLSFRPDSWSTLISTFIYAYRTAQSFLCTNNHCASYGVESTRNISSQYESMWLARELLWTVLILFYFTPPPLATILLRKLMKTWSVCNFDIILISALRCDVCKQNMVEDAARRWDIKPCHYNEGFLAEITIRETMTIQMAQLSLPPRSKEKRLFDQITVILQDDLVDTISIGT